MVVLTALAAVLFGVKAVERSWSARRVERRQAAEAARVAARVARYGG